VDAAYYSTPPGWIGQRVHVTAPRTRPRAARHHGIAEADRPSRTPATTVVLLAGASRRRASPHDLHVYPRSRGCGRRTPHPRRARQEIRAGRRR
jgi:hypothetical protein